MSSQHQLHEIGSQVAEQLHDLFDKESLEKLAREQGFVKRSSSQLTGSDFVQLLTVELLEEPAVSYEGMCDRLQQLNPEVDITPQALEQRVNGEGAVQYLRAVLERALIDNLTPTVRADSELLAPFGRVFLQDSTHASVHEKLAEEFKGAGGSASQGGVKVDLTYELKHQVIQQLHLYASASSDQSHAEELLEELRATDLVVRDLGYFKLTALAAIAGRGAYYLSRLLKDAAVYLSPDQEQPLDLTAYLNTHYADSAVIELAVYVGKDERLPSRLIAYRLPPEVVSERRRKARVGAAKKGRTPTRAYLEWLAFGFYITNVAATVWSAEVIGTIYRLRWQIELTFKNWKSLLAIHVLKGTRSERIQCLIYARLTAVVMLNMLARPAAWYAHARYQLELSGPKFINWLKRKARLSEVITQGRLTTLFDQLAQGLRRLCKQRRKRPTTRQLIDRKINYMESFIDLEAATQEA